MGHPRDFPKGKRGAELCSPVSLIAMINLLFLGNWWQTDDSAKPVVETPFGTVRLEAQIAGRPLNSDQTDTYTLGAEARLFVWKSRP